MAPSGEPHRHSEGEAELPVSKRELADFRMEKALALNLMALGVEDVEIIGVAKGEQRDAGKEIFHRPGMPPKALPLVLRPAQSEAPSVATPGVARP